MKKIGVSLNKNAAAKEQITPELAEAIQEPKSFKLRTFATKSALAGLVLKYAPLDDCDNLLAYLDYLRILVLEENGAKFILENGGEEFVYSVVSKYFIENDFDTSANPKAVRIITWRFLANCTK